MRQYGIHNNMHLCVLGWITFWDPVARSQVNVVISSTSHESTLVPGLVWKQTNVTTITIGAGLSFLACTQSVHSLQTGGRHFLFPGGSLKRRLGKVADRQVGLGVNFVEVEVAKAAHLNIHLMSELWRSLEEANLSIWTLEKANRSKAWLVKPRHLLGHLETKNTGW